MGVSAGEKTDDPERRDQSRGCFYRPQAQGGGVYPGTAGGFPHVGEACLLRSHRPAAHAV